MSTNQFERIFTSSSVPGYMNRLRDLFIKKLRAKGYASEVVGHDDSRFILLVSDPRGNYSVFLVKCINNSLIEWSRVT